MISEDVDDNPHAKTKPQVEIAVERTKVQLQRKNVAPCPSPGQHQTEVYEGRNHPLVPFLLPDPDDLTIVTIEGDLVEIKNVTA
jgi:hypothetical protein